MSNKISLGALCLLFAIEGCSTALGADSLTLAQARRAIDASAPEARLAGVERLGEIGTAADANRLVARLADGDDSVRASSVDAMWRIWSRSGDRAIDALFRRGLEQMQSAHLDDALATFTEVIRRKPQFAEGWNKRATIHYLLGRHAESLKDCAEVIKRNPIHFGALSGYAQIYIALGDPERALEYYERALKVNPNLPNAAEAIGILEDQVAAKRRNTI